MKYVIIAFLFLCILPVKIYAQKDLDAIQAEEQKYTHLFQSEAAAANDNGSNVSDEKYVRFNLVMNPWYFTCNHFRFSYTLFYHHYTQCSED